MTVGLQANATQVLFLGEDALIASAAGTINGSVILSSILIIVTLVAAALLQLYKADLRKPIYMGGLFSGK